VTGPPFALFGAAHLAVLGLTAAAAVSLCGLVRRRPRAGPAVRAALVLALAGFTALYVGALSREGPLSVWDLVPLHLCDFLILVAAYALVTLHPAACELLYFWAGTGALLATLTPDLREGWPDWRFVVYFGLHGAVVVSAAVAVFGLGRRPRPGAAWRALVLTNAYAAVVAVVDVVWGMNFLYLREKPWTPTLLDWLGPWPVYLLSVEVLALFLFVLLALPFERPHWPRGLRLRARGHAD
jgi:hypothetical integral membrane protein (TIGR02206 family)